MKCDGVTTMGTDIAETYARNPHFYGSTFCVHCKDYFQLKNKDGSVAFLWEPHGSPVGE